MIVTLMWFLSYLPLFGNFWLFLLFWVYLSPWFLLLFASFFVFC